jgi:hypothetical protein
VLVQWGKPHRTSRDGAFPDDDDDDDDDMHVMDQFLLNLEDKME